MLLDHNGNPIQTKTLKAEIAAPQPSGARTIASSMSGANLDPAKLSRILQSAETDDARAYLELAEIMEEKYLHYAAQLATRKRAVSGITAEIIPASDEEKDHDIAEFIARSLPVIQAALYDMLDAIGKGFSVTEIIWDTSGSEWKPGALALRDPRWFMFDKVDGRTLKLRSDQNPEGEALTPGKFILHTAAAKSGLPIRGGMARAACWAWLFQNFSLKDWVSFIEMYGKPLRLGRYEAGAATPADLSILFEAVQGLGTDAAAMLPKSMEIEFPEVGNARGENGLWLALMEYLDRQVSKLVLGQTLTADTGEGGGGSYALGNVHNEVRLDILFDDAQNLAATVNRDLIRLFVDLNFAGVTEYPQFRLRVEEPEDQVALIGIVEKAVAMGQPIGQKWFSDKFGIPLPEAGEDLLGQQAALPEGSDGERKTASNAETKFDASLINAYSMGIDRFVRLGMAVPEQFVRDVFSIPVPAQGEKLLEPTAEAMPEAETTAHRAAQKLSPAPRHLIPESDAAELATPQLSREAQPHIDRWLARIEAMLEAAGSLEEFKAMLLAAYPTLEGAELTETLAAALTALDLRGRAEVAGGA